MLTIIDALKAFINMKQKEGEQLINYLKQFKTARDVFVLHLGGPLILSKIVEEHVKYTKLQDLRNQASVAAVCEKLEKNGMIVQQVYDTFLAGLYLDNCNKLIDR